MELRYTLKLFQLGSSDAIVLGKCLTMAECCELIKEKGFGAFDWYKSQHRDPSNTIDVWSINQLPK